MKRKKSPEADLERQRTTFFQIGVVISLSLILFAFECTRSTGALIDLGTWNPIDEETELIPITRAKEKPKPEIKKPKPVDVIEIVDNNEELLEDPIIEDSEVDQYTQIEPVDFNDEEAEDIPFYGSAVLPEFPGGERALRQFIKDNIQFPEIAKEIHLTGKVYLHFVVTKTGKIGKIEVLRSVDPVLDNEAIRVIKLLPKWNPGLQAGKPVSVWYSIDINFQLE
ncbi:MAG: energy transducer TonB [Chlorobi bacterium]|nr:energy transducer TonB [Chlorobiota bacterium]